MNTIRLPKAKVAQMIRRQLKNSFSGVKFSVRCRRGDSILVEYTDGPDSSEIDSLVDIFKGTDFDGMMDMSTYRGSFEYEGKSYISHVDHIIVNRYSSTKTPHSFLAVIG